jgi:hypothetical protein
LSHCHLPPVADYPHHSRSQSYESTGWHYGEQSHCFGRTLPIPPLFSE